MTTKEKEDIYNQQTLWKYLTLQLMKDHRYPKAIAKAKAHETIKASTNLWGKNGLAVDLGRKNITFFFLYFLQDVFTPKENNTARNLGAFHYEIWEELQKLIIEDKYNFEEFILSRGASKTTVINKALNCYMTLYRISRYSIVIGKTKQDSSDFMDDIKKFFKFEPIVKGFGNLISGKRTVNQQELELDNDTCIRAYGWETSIRGTTYSAPDGIFRPMAITIDDILSADSIKTENAKENAINKFYKEILEAGDEPVIRNGKQIKMGTKFIILGTPLAADCFINTIRKDPQFKVFKRAVVDFNIDEYFQNNEYWQNYNKILFNTKINKEDKDSILETYYNENIENMTFPTIWEKYNCRKLANKYFTQRSSFMQELMVDCENVGEKWFKSIRKMPYAEILSTPMSKTILVCDPASTVTNKSDYTAILCGGLGENGFKYVIEGVIEKLTFDQYCNRVIEFLKKYVLITHIVIERNTFNSSDVIAIQKLIKQDKSLLNRNLEFINKHQTANKDQKISTQIDSINSGSLIFCEDNEDFIQQCQAFTGQKTSLKDDAIDCVAEFALKIDEIHTIRKLTFLDRRLLGI